MPRLREDKDRRILGGDFGYCGEIEMDDPAWREGFEAREKTDELSDVV